MSVITNHFLKIIPFSRLDLWDTKRYTYQNNLTFDNVVRLSEILFPQKKIITKEDMRKNNFRIISKINFGGELFLRDYSEIDTYKGNLFLVPSNAIIYSKINVRHGCIFFNDEFSSPFGVSSEYPIFTFDNKRVSGYFLQKLLRTAAFKELLNTKSTGISKARVKQDEFLDIQVPLPSLPEQEKIVEAYYAKINEAKQLAIEATNINQEIEKYLFTELGISIGHSLGKLKGLNIVEYSKIERWGVEYNLNGSNSLLSSTKYPNKRLRDIILINPTTQLPKESAFPISFIPMEVVSDDYGIVTELRSKTISEAKGYTRFKEGDLLWARITPCMQNGKSAIVKNLDNGLGVGSTEFHVLRNENPTINLDYIYHFLRLDIVLKDAMSHFTGSAGQQRVPKSYLEELLIPIPQYEKQTEISNHLYQLKDLKIKLFNKVEELKRQANEEFEKAIFQ